MTNQTAPKLVLNDRLLGCSEFVTRGGIACDVGTDHAYLASYLAMNGISKHVYACDIALGPLEAARSTVSKLGLSDKVTIIQSDGLDNVPNENVTDVIIAGMGGELITDIVLRADWLKRGVNLVLQPQSKASELRKALCENGYEIKSEKAFPDRDFCYPVINAVYTGSVIELDEISSIVGKLDLNAENSRKYIKTVADRMISSASGISRSKDESTRERAKKLSETAQKLYQLIGG